MAYDREKKYKMALKVIKDEKLCFINEVPEMIGITRDTFYTIFPIGSLRFMSIKDALKNNL